VAWSGAASHLPATDTLSSPVSPPFAADENGHRLDAVCEQELQPVNVAIVVRYNSTVMVTEDEELTPRLTGDDLAATRG
jgi:hypothetical protein